MDPSKQRFEQEYFRIGCYGMGFHDFLQVRNNNEIPLIYIRFFFVVFIRIMFLFIDQNQEND